MTIEGRSTTLIALSDFVGNLGHQHAAAEADRDRQQPGASRRRRDRRSGAELIQFTVKAPLAPEARGSRGARRAAAAARAAQAAALKRPADCPIRRQMAMNLSLSKLPWYGQVGAFVALALGGVGAFWNCYAQPAQESHRRSARRSWRRSAPRSIAGWPPRGGCRSSAARSPRSKRSSIGCAPCCPRSRTSPICCAACRRWRRSPT